VLFLLTNFVVMAVGLNKHAQCDISS